VTSAYRDSFLRDRGIAVATARAGNVIGGGDWAADRLVPDLLRAHEAGEVLHVRSPRSVRPWQHVLEPLSGYIKLAEHMLSGMEFPDAVNFGSSEEDSKPVSWIVERLCSILPEADWRSDEGEHPHEAGLLRLDSGLAGKTLGWRPHWDLAAAIRNTVDWELSRRNGANMVDVSMDQISAFEESR
jgi:CDP-glucose 4,6-dehydratase